MKLWLSSKVEVLLVVEESIAVAQCFKATCSCVPKKTILLCLAALDGQEGGGAFDSLWLFDGAEKLRPATAPVSGALSAAPVSVARAP